MPSRLPAHTTAAGLGRLKGAHHPRLWLYTKPTATKPMLNRAQRQLAGSRLLKRFFLACLGGCRRFPGECLGINTHCKVPRHPPPTPAFRGSSNCKAHSAIPPDSQPNAHQHKSLPAPAACRGAESQTWAMGIQSLFSAQPKGNTLHREHRSLLYSRYQRPGQHQNIAE